MVSNLYKMYVNGVKWWYVFLIRLNSISKLKLLTEFIFDQSIGYQQSNTIFSSHKHFPFAAFHTVAQCQCHISLMQTLKMTIYFFALDFFFLSLPLSLSSIMAAKHHCHGDPFKFKEYEYEKVIEYNGHIMTESFLLKNKKKKCRKSLMFIYFPFQFDLMWKLKRVNHARVCLHQSPIWIAGQYKSRKHTLFSIYRLADIRLLPAPHRPSTIYFYGWIDCIQNETINKSLLPSLKWKCVVLCYIELANSLAGLVSLNESIHAHGYNSIPQNVRVYGLVLVSLLLIFRFFHC